MKGRSFLPGPLLNPVFRNNQCICICLLMWSILLSGHLMADKPANDRNRYILLDSRMPGLIGRKVIVNALWIKMDDEPWVKWKGIEVGCKWHWAEVNDPCWCRCA